MSNIYGVAAKFDTVGSLVHAVEAVRDAGYTKFDSYSPFPIHGIDDSQGLKPSPLAWIVLVGGALGLSCGMLLQWWTSAVDYPLVISGKPLFSYQAFIPVTFELMILLSAFATVFGMFALNKLPEFYHPMFRHTKFSKVTDDAFFVSIEASDPKYDESAVKELLSKLGGSDIEVLNK